MIRKRKVLKDIQVNRWSVPPDEFLDKKHSVELLCSCLFQFRSVCRWLSSLFSSSQYNEPKSHDSLSVYLFLIFFLFIRLSFMSWILMNFSCLSVSSWFKRRLTRSHAVFCNCLSLKITRLHENSLTKQIQIQMRMKNKKNSFTFILIWNVR